MKDEIKEILRDLEFASGVFDYTITPDRCTFLKDYITNLQKSQETLIKNDNEIITNLQEELEIMVKDDERSQETIIKLSKENEKLKENAEHNDKVVDKAKWNEMLYKSRIDKANEFIDNYDVFKEFSFPLMKRDVEQQIKSSIDYEFKITFRNKLLNILNGGDKD